METADSARQPEILVPAFFNRNSISALMQRASSSFSILPLSQPQGRASHRTRFRFLAMMFLLWVLPSRMDAQAVDDASPRETVLFDSGWRFQKGDPADGAGKLGYDAIKAWLLPTGNAFTADSTAKAERPKGNPGGLAVSYAGLDFDDRYWRQLDLPHDWVIEGSFDPKEDGSTGKLRYDGPVWYRKRFTLPASDRGRQIFLDVDGAMSYASVWVNGQCAGGWPYGYASFRVDLTPYLQTGEENVVAIRLDTPPHAARWYPGGGIYRNVWLVKTAPVHVAQWGLHVTTPEISPDSATVDCQVTVDNDSSSAAQSRVRTEIYSLGQDGAPGKNPVASSDWTGLTVPAGTDAMAEVKVPLPNPDLWDLVHPHLYRLRAIVQQDGAQVDRLETTFGVRSIKFDPVQGFLLNGRHVPLQGVCMHSDLGALGDVVNSRGLERQLQILQEMGCNAVRTSHNPPSPELIDLCDRMGILIMAESLDCWTQGKVAGDYHLLFADWSERDIRSLVRHFRNDPCVILWSMGNEIPEQQQPEGAGIAARLSSYAHDEDTTRPTTIACSAPVGGFNGFQEGFDVFGFNYECRWSWGKQGPDIYPRFHQANPTIPVMGSETSSACSSRGCYFLPIDQSLQDIQVSSYDNWTPAWATEPDVEFQNQEKNPFVLGEFVWTGFDYLGEPTPYNNDRSILLNTADPAKRAEMEAQLKKIGAVPSRSSYFGIVDLCGFKKDRFYLYQSHWRPDFPMAHILPHWNWPDRSGQTIPVYVYTSGDSAELFLNGRPLGRKIKQPLEYRLEWDVPYQPGKLEAVAYKEGREWARDTMRTAGPAAQLLVQPDRDTLAADGRDLSFVKVTIADKDGIPVPTASNSLHFDLAGPADLIATDNGDATDLASFQSPDRKAFNGLALAVVRTRAGDAGPITLQVKSDGLPTVRIEMTSR